MNQCMEQGQQDMNQATQNEGGQEKWHWMIGTTFTKLQKEYFEIIVVLGTFKCSSYKQNKHI